MSETSKQTTESEQNAQSIAEQIEDAYEASDESAIHLKTADIDDVLEDIQSVRTIETDLNGEPYPDGPKVSVSHPCGFTTFPASDFKSVEATERTLKTRWEVRDKRDMVVVTELTEEGADEAAAESQREAPEDAPYSVHEVQVK